MNKTTVDIDPNLSIVLDETASAMPVSLKVTRDGDLVQAVDLTRSEVTRMIRWLQAALDITE